MTKHRAIAEMVRGKKITHRYFTAKEYVHIEGGILKDEDGNWLKENEFWALRTGAAFDMDWEIWEDGQ